MKARNAACDAVSTYVANVYSNTTRVTSTQYRFIGTSATLDLVISCDTKIMQLTETLITESNITPPEQFVVLTGQG